jgi:hypothetical protein
MNDSSLVQSFLKLAVMVNSSWPLSFLLQLNRFLKGHQVNKVIRSADQQVNRSSGQQSIWSADQQVNMSSRQQVNRFRSTY